MPCFNAGLYLPSAIESILLQEGVDLELVIVDDGSIDNSVSIVCEYLREDSRIKLFENRINKGIVHTLNFGIDKCQGLFIARMDADDVSLPGRLLHQVSFLQKHADIGILGTSMKYIGDANGLCNTYTKHDEIRAAQLFDGGLHHPTVMFRAEIFRTERYSSGFPHMEDYELFYRLGAKNKMAALPEPLYNYRVHPIAVTKSNSHSLAERAILMHERVLNDLSIFPTSAELSLHFGLWRSELKKDQLAISKRWIHRIMSAAEHHWGINSETLDKVLDDIFQKSLFKLLENEGVHAVSYMFIHRLLRLAHLRFVAGKICHK
jgi:glycosyltransferase involved in cell wall biosynthesis